MKLFTEYFKISQSRLFSCYFKREFLLYADYFADYWGFIYILAPKLVKIFIFVELMWKFLYWRIFLSNMSDVRRKRKQLKRILGVLTIFQSAQDQMMNLIFFSKKLIFF